MIVFGRLIVFRWPRIWIVRPGERRPPPRTIAELDAFVELAFDGLLYRSDLAAIPMEALEKMAARCDLEIVSATDRRNVVMRIRDAP